MFSLISSEFYGAARNPAKHFSRGILCRLIDCLIQAFLEQRRHYLNGRTRKSRPFQNGRLAILPF
jgi:hypothetical protein